MNSKLKKFCTQGCLISFFIFQILTNVAHADALFDVTITGEVGFNQINTSVLADAVPGDLVVISFQVDADNFQDSMIFPVRGYEIIESSFAMQFGSATVGLEMPSGETPLFVIRNDDPAVDGFFLGTSLNGFPNGVATDQTGIFGQFRSNFSVGYDNDPLDSLDIAGAAGSYDFTGLTSFGFTIDDGPFAAAEVNFSNLTISSTVIPEPTLGFPLFGFGILLVSKRRCKSS